MASEMLGKILEAEEAARGKKENARAEAKAILDKAALTAKDIVSSAANQARAEADKALKECGDAARVLVQKSLDEAKAVCDKMQNDASSRQEACTRCIKEKLFG